MYIALFFLVIFYFPNQNFQNTWLGTETVRAATDLRGRILLQVQDKGQAWYVNPADGRRYYLGRPEDAFLLMRSLGLGVSNADFVGFGGRAPARLAGRILLQVQDKGQAYYVSPLDYRLHYLGRPSDAFSVMRSQGLGISNLDLEKIPLDPNLLVDQDKKTVSYEFKYQNADYRLNQVFSVNLYNKYSSSAKVLTYSSSNPPANPRDSFYGMFLTVQPQDKTLDSLVSDLKKIAAENQWSSDQLAEFSLSLVQHIPYDDEKVSTDDNRNNNPYYPYETLFLNRGVCSDKTFLAVALLRRLGYGAAILDFPDSNHSAAGIACPVSDSISGSGYCYVETTNFFPVGIVPQSISAGQAQLQKEFGASFDPSNLGAMEIYQATTGLEYGGLEALRGIIEKIKKLQDEIFFQQADIKRQEAEHSRKEEELVIMRAEMDDYLSAGQVSLYNQLVPDYNVLVNDYNSGLASYQELVRLYNSKVLELNGAVNAFYQK